MKFSEIFKSGLLSILLLLSYSSISAQMKWDISALSTLPHSEDDNVQPRLGLLLLGHINCPINQEVSVTGGLGVGNTKSDIQYIALGEGEFWENTREDLFYLRSEILFTLVLGKSHSFSLEAGPGVEYVFSKRYNGTWIFDPLEDGSPPQARHDLRRNVTPAEDLRFVLSSRVLYNARVYGRNIQIGPYFDYADSGAVENEVASRKFGFYMAITFNLRAIEAH